MSATAAQIKYCNDLIDAGAGFELKMPHEDSIEAADAFIKKWKHLKPSRMSKQEYFDMVRDMDPSDYNVPNM
ncbi:hypothetical protein NVP1031O_078 [Vibrio phage 1.031.O._10N.261.46.F8]|nr:hypothetical protein NVP1031O_078 [Vibrio phage 1.031.O._10N.261.46.F8]